MALSNLQIGAPYCVDGNTPVVPLTWNMGGAASVTVKYRAKEIGGPDINLSTNVTTGFIAFPYTPGNHYVIVVVNNADANDYIIYGSGSPGVDPSDFTSTATPCNVAPFQPNTLAANPASPSSITLTWVDGSDNEQTFEIQRAPSNSGPWNTVVSALANAGNYTDVGLTPNTQYYYRVRAVNQYGNSPWSNTANATTMAQTSSGGSGGGGFVLGSFLPDSVLSQPGPTKTLGTLSKNDLNFIVLLIAFYFLFLRD